MFEDNDLSGLLEIISKGKTILNIGSEEMCAPCRRMSPLFNELKEKNEDIMFIKIDVQHNADVAEHFNVGGIPHFISLNEGEKVSEFKGSNELKLNEMVESLKGL